MAAYVKPVWKKTVATMNHPTIEAAVGKLYRFKSESQAQRRLDAIRQHFILSKEQPDVPSAVRLWIRGFEITDAEMEEGYKGHFVTISVCSEEPGIWTLRADKELVPLDHHPQKQRPKQRHPDWGYPLLRHVKKRPVFQDVEEARAVLQQLHQDFPEVSIPLTNKMYIMIYGKEHAPPPVQKWVLEIKPVEEGGFVIEHFINPNPRKRKAEGEATEAAEAEKPASPSGYFTSMVQLKRKPPKGAPVPKRPAETPDEAGGE